MWWMSDDGERLINLDNVCFMEAMCMGITDRVSVFFHYENRPSEAVNVASLDEAKAMLRSIHNALRHEDEERHGAARHCSVCVERCEEAK